MGKIAKNYIYNFAFQLLVMITPIITAPYLSRVLGAERLGIYGYVNSSGNIIYTISLLGIYAYGNRQIAYVRDNKEDFNRNFWEIMLTRLILGTAGTAIYFIYAAVNRDTFWYFLLYFPYVFAQFIDCSWVYVGTENMKPAVMKNFFARIVNVIGIFVFVKDKDDIGVYIFLLAITIFVANLSIYPQLRQYIGKPSADKSNILKHLRGSVVLFLPQVASLFYLQVDKVMLKWLSGSTAQVSFYDQAEKLINIPLTLITVLSTVMMPRIANEFKKNNRDTIQSLLIKSGRFTLFMAFPLMAGLFCVARQFVPWYLGGEFLPTAYGMMILAPIVLFNSLAGISGSQYFTATDQIGILMRAYVPAAVLNVIVNAILIPPFGYAGAAIATLISALVSVVIQYYYLNKQVKLTGLTKYGFIYAAGALIMMAAIVLPTFKMSVSPLTTLIQVAAGGSVYLVYLLAIRDGMLKEIIDKAFTKLKIKR
jgi:O-antigen/teichoic acid export membrane protein